MGGEILRGKKISKRTQIFPLTNLQSHDLTAVGCTGAGHCILRGPLARPLSALEGRYIFFAIEMHYR
jgi:hypothetical protein